MLEDHSLGLLTATVISIIVYIAGLAVNLSDFARQYISIPLIPSILRENTSNATRPQILPISLADWSIPLWGVVYVLQLFWLAYAVVGICRKTAAGPAYNNPKLLPVQVHLFFTLGVLMQIGWLVSMDRNNLGFALFLSLPATGFFITCVGESYRALAGTQALLLQQDRIADLWAVRILAQNGLALLMSWMTLHMTLTFALFLAYGMASYAVDRDTASLVGVSLSTSLVVIYVLCDILLLDRYARLIVSPYLAAVVFTAAQINKDWPDTHTAVFGVLAALTTFSFLAVLLKATVLLWRQLPPRNSETKGMATRPLPSELEEEAYLLEATKLIVSPYLAAVVFTAAQINKDWPDTHTAVFGVLAALTTFSFLAVLLKATVLLWRQLPPRNSETKGMATRPLPSELEEEAYLLEARTIFSVETRKRLSTRPRLFGVS